MQAEILESYPTLKQTCDDVVSRHNLSVGPCNRNLQTSKAPLLNLNLEYD